MRVVRIVGIVVVAAAVAAAAWWWTHREAAADGAPRASGTVEATESRLGFDTGGQLAAVVPREGDRVEAGEVVARLSDEEAEAHRAQAAAAVSTAEAHLAELEAGSRPEEVAEARAAAAAAEEQLADAGRDVERAETLYAGGAASREAYDKAQTGREVAAQRLAQARQRLRLVERGPRAEQVAAARAQLAQARAGLAEAETRVAHRTLSAPSPGVVTVRHHEPGEVVAPGSPVLTLMDPDDRWVRIYVPEDRVGAVSLGMPATITTDTFPGKSYGGEVAYIASEAEFTPKNVQTQEERVRLVYAVKVRVTGDPGQELKPGMPADVVLGAPAGGGGR